MFGQILIYVCLAGIVLTVPVCFVMWMHERGVFPLRDLLALFRRLPPLGRIVLMVLAAELWLFGGSKRQSDDPLENLSGAMSGVMSSNEFSADELGAGYALWRVDTNGVWNFSPHPGSVEIDAWRLRGAAGDWQLLDLSQAVTNAAVMMGWPTNGTVVPRLPAPLANGLWAAAPEGRLLRMCEGVTNDVFSALGLSASLVPEANWCLLAGSNAASRVWYNMTPWRSVCVTWENVCIGRNVNAPANVQMEFMSDGVIVYRCGLPATEGASSNGVATVRRNGCGLTVDLPQQVGVTSLAWYPLDGLAEEDDEDGDGLSNYQEIAVCHSDPDLTDSDGDGWSDYDEVTGNTPAGAPTDPMVSSVPNEDIVARIVGSPTNELYQSCATVADEELVSLKLWDGFMAEWTSTNCDIVYERTLDLGAQTGWQHYFLSSKGSAAAGWDFRGLTLEWDDGCGSSGVVMASPDEDSFYLPLTNGSANVTIRLRAIGPRIRAPKPMYLLCYSPVVTIGGGMSVTDEDGAEVAIVATNGCGAVLSVSVDRSNRPCSGDLYAGETVLPGLTDVGDWSDGSFSYVGDASGGTITVNRPGVCELPITTAGGMSSAGQMPMLRGSYSNGKVLAVIDPSISYGGDHVWESAGVGYDWYGDEYDIEYRYPLNSKCLWRAWRCNGSGGADCSCVPEVWSGAGDAWSVNTDYTVDESTGTAVGYVYVLGQQVWSGTAQHSWRDAFGGNSGSSGCTLLTELDACESCEGTCTGGKCDYGDGTALNSVKFRSSLGSPRQGQTSGFIYFESDGPVSITPYVFETEFRSDAAITVAYNGSTRTYRCADDHGMDIVMATINNGRSCRSAPSIVSSTDGT